MGNPACEQQSSLPACEYDAQWAVLDDFSRYNPGARHRRRIILHLLQELRFSTLLDVGCGRAQLLRALERHVPPHVKMVGADFSQTALDESRILCPRASFTLLNLLENALPEKFDLVICSEVIEHLENRRQAIINLSAMVNEGGHLLLSCPTGRLYQTERVWGHVSHPTPREIRELAAIAGLKVKKLINWGFPSYSALKWITNVNPDWSCRHFGSGEYGAAAKFVSNALYYANFLSLPSSPWGCQLFALLEKPVGAATST